MFTFSIILYWYIDRGKRSVAVKLLETETHHVELRSQKLVEPIIMNPIFSETFTLLLTKTFLETWAQFTIYLGIDR